MLSRQQTGVHPCLVSTFDCVMVTEESASVGLNVSVLDRFLGTTMTSEFARLFHEDFFLSKFAPLGSSINLKYPILPIEPY